jgi:hypothetical protein
MYNRAYFTSKHVFQRVKCRPLLVHRKMVTNMGPNPYETGYGGGGGGGNEGPDWESIFVMLVGSCLFYSVVKK